MKAYLLSCCLPWWRRYLILARSQKSNRHEKSLDHERKQEWVGYAKQKKDRTQLQSVHRKWQRKRKTLIRETRTLVRNVQHAERHLCKPANKWTCIMALKHWHGIFYIPGSSSPDHFSFVRFKFSKQMDSVVRVLWVFKAGSQNPPGFRSSSLDSFGKCEGGQAFGLLPVFHNC